jgi:hypothetical protein
MCDLRASLEWKYAFGTEKEILVQRKLFHRTFYVLHLLFHSLRNLFTSYKYVRLLSRAILFTRWKFCPGSFDLAFKKIPYGNQYARDQTHVGKIMFYQCCGSGSVLDTHQI